MGWSTAGMRGHSRYQLGFECSGRAAEGRKPELNGWHHSR